MGFMGTCFEFGKGFILPSVQTDVITPDHNFPAFLCSCSIPSFCLPLSQSDCSVIPPDTTFHLFWSYTFHRSHVSLYSTISLLIQSISSCWLVCGFVLSSYSICPAYYMHWEKIVNMYITIIAPTRSFSHYCLHTPLDFQHVQKDR